MVSIEWCKRQKLGIKLISPNKNMSDSYLKMAEESLKVLNNVKESKIWTATTTYYVFYYSLYSLMLRIGIKCEIHACSLEVMKKFFSFYNEKDVEMIEKAFSARIDLQYYTNRPVNNKIIIEVNKYCKDFYVKTKDILSKLSEEEIKVIRENIKKKA